MARSLARFSALQVMQLAKAQADRTRLHHDGGGLYLCVDRRGASVSWLFRYMMDGRARTMGLGAYPATSLAEARRRAEDARRLKSAGEDPLAHRGAEKARRKAATPAPAKRLMTFEQAASAFIDAHQASWKNAKHADQWPSTLRAYAYPLIGSQPVAQVDTAAVLQVLRQPIGEAPNAKPLWEARPETAKRLKGRIEKVLDWARVAGHSEGDNPARWKSHLEFQLPARWKVAPVEHHAAMPIDELPGFIGRLRAQPGTAARALEFTILTAARTGETIGATWAEIDVERGLWTIPANRMKGGREHRVPLCARALEILRLQRVDDTAPGEPVFHGRRRGRPQSNMAFLMVLRRMGLGEITAHGFRSTFRDWAAERTDAPNEVAEMALAHSVGDKTEAAYRRGDMFEKRRQLADAWAAYCASKA